MAVRGRKNADLRLIAALAAGETVAEAAVQAGISERTAHRRQEDPVFRRRVDEERGRMLDRAVNRLSSIGADAAKKLGDLMLGKKTPPAVQLGACRAILEHMLRGNELVALARQVDEMRRELDEVRANGKREAQATGEGTAAGVDGAAPDASAGPS